MHSRELRKATDAAKQELTRARPGGALPALSCRLQWRLNEQEAHPACGWRLQLRKGPAVDRAAVIGVPVAGSDIQRRHLLKADFSSIARGDGGEPLGEKGGIKSA